MFQVSSNSKYSPELSLKFWLFLDRSLIKHQSSWLDKTLRLFMVRIVCNNKRQLSQIYNSKHQIKISSRSKMETTRIISSPVVPRASSKRAKNPLLVTAWTWQVKRKGLLLCTNQRASPPNFPNIVFNYRNHIHDE